MFMSNPFAELSTQIPVAVMQGYVVLMVAFVVIGTILDMMHKKSAKYFFLNAEKPRRMPSVKSAREKKLPLPPRCWWSKWQPPANSKM